MAESVSLTRDSDNGEGSSYWHMSNTKALFQFVNGCGPAYHDMCDGPVMACFMNAVYSGRSGVQPLPLPLNPPTISGNAFEIGKWGDIRPSGTGDRMSKAIRESNAPACKAYTKRCDFKYAEAKQRYEKSIEGREAHRSYRESVEGREVRPKNEERFAVNLSARQAVGDASLAVAPPPTTGHQLCHTTRCPQIEEVPAI